MKFPPHKLGHTLDIIATFVDDPKISGIESSEYDLSHHLLVQFDVAVLPEMHLYKMIKYRNIQNIDWNQFNQDIDSGLNITGTASFEEIITKYNEVVTRLLDDHAPHKSRKVKIVQDAP